MAEITASMVKELRECTGAGMMECKKALTETEGDIEKAVDVLRTRGLAALAKKSGRATNEGTVAAYVSDDSRVGVLVEVNCETDFVGRNADFTGFVGSLAQHVAAEAPADVDELKTQTVADRDITVEQVLGEMVGKLGENMGIARFVRETVEGTGAVATYVHGGGKIGVMVTYAFTKPETAATPEFSAFSKDVAMQVAAASPMVTRRDEVDASVLEHELSIYKAQAAESGKPEAIQEKMAQGRIEKFYKEVVLAEQQFVKNMDITVDQYTKETSKATGDSIEIIGFIRFNLGESAAE
ncbi:MAG: elongation factor Ts [Actinobacteria bacterium HGW-Actinobacteria-7]|nr:MAG: elongation factor Ts [Actinobacteria bacterium HGW-Actinobacteria-7]